VPPRRETPGTAAAPAGLGAGRRLAMLVALLTLIALGRLAIQVPRLVAGPPEVFGAVDLAYRFAEVRCWFAGLPVYGALDTAVYPPATYALLWPWLGWADWPAARLLWAATALPALLWLALQCARGAGAGPVFLPCSWTGASAATGRLDGLGRAAASGARPGKEEGGWWLGFLLPVSFYATGVTLGAGQMLVHLLPVLIAAALLLARRPTLGRDLAAAGLLTLALAKPNATAPFLWLALLPPGGTRGLRWRPLAFTAALYLSLTLLALSFQPAAPSELLAAWRPTAAGVAAASGYGHLPVWLEALGLGRWQLPASVLAALALGIWIARHRMADPWVLLGVTGIFARVWSYHQYYDDLLVVPALVAVLRLARREGTEPALRTRARRVFGAALGLTLLPIPLHYALEPPWRLLFDLPQMLAWAALLAVLVPAATPSAQPPAAALASTVA